ncbi:MAG TPA: glycosyltransferase family A protein [Trueperaceae bacterium]
MSLIDILIPTIDRPQELAVTLAGVASQTHRELRVIVADQSATPAYSSAAIATLRRLIEARGGKVDWHHRKPCHGIAEQRSFLLERATAPKVLLLDDDVFMEPWVLTELERVLDEEGIGFVGAFPAGLSFVDDVRPNEQRVEFWEGPVRPEVVEPDSAQWQRARLHAAANIYHAAERLAPGTVRRYKVAWVGACALYDRQKLEEVGGFSFWSELPADHAGEEVLVQNLLLRRWGGCAIMPSGTYHAEAPTTIGASGRTPQANALTLLPTMLERLGLPRVPAENPR